MADAAAVADRDLGEAHHLGEVVEGQRVLEIGVAQQWRQPGERRQRGEERALAVERPERLVVEPDDDELLRLVALGKDDVARRIAGRALLPGRRRDEEEP